MAAAGPRAPGMEVEPRGGRAESRWGRAWKGAATRGDRSADGTRWGIGARGSAAVCDCSWARTRVGTGIRAGGSRQASAVPMPTQFAGLGLPCRPRSGCGHRFSPYTNPNVGLPLSARGRDRWERRCGAPRVPRVGLGHGSVRVTNPAPGGVPM